MLMPVHLSPSVRRVRLLMSALLLAGLIAVALLSTIAPAAAKAKGKASHVPQGFVGVDIDGPLFDPRDSAQPGQADEQHGHQRRTERPGGL